VAETSVAAVAVEAQGVDVVVDVAVELLAPVETSKALRDRPLRARPPLLLNHKDNPLDRTRLKARLKASRDSPGCNTRTTPATRALVLPLLVLLDSRDAPLLRPEALPPRRLHLRLSCQATTPRSSRLLQPNPRRLRSR
jgi:hypothetical protein